jgi:hypothetical protein
MNNDKYKCPNCGKHKKPWFELCWDCTEKEKQKPRCEICGKDVPDGHSLCKEHWMEKQEGKKHLKNLDSFVTKKEIEYKAKFEGKYYFNSQKVKSKSELIICYFLAANGIIFSYEPMMNLDGKEIRPDFVIDDGKGNTIILEHFGLDTDDYKAKRESKEKALKKLCDADNSFFFIVTEEEDIYNLKDRLGKRFNDTPIKKVMWK